MWLLLLLHFSHFLFHIPNGSVLSHLQSQSFRLLFGHLSLFFWSLSKYFFASLILFTLEFVLVWNLNWLLKKTAVWFGAFVSAGAHEHTCLLKHISEYQRTYSSNRFSSPTSKCAMWIQGEFVSLGSTHPYVLSPWANFWSSIRMV